MRISKGKFWKSLKNFKKRIKKDPNGNYYYWDYTHNDIEMFDRRGHHKGSIDPATGQRYKKGEDKKFKF